MKYFEWSSVLGLTPCDISPRLGRRSLLTDHSLFRSKRQGEHAVLANLQKEISQNQRTWARMQSIFAILSIVLMIVQVCAVLSWCFFV